MSGQEMSVNEELVKLISRLTDRILPDTATSAPQDADSDRTLRRQDAEAR